MKQENKETITTICTIVGTVCAVISAASSVMMLMRLREDIKSIDKSVRSSSALLARATQMEKISSEELARFSNPNLPIGPTRSSA